MKFIRILGKKLREELKQQGIKYVEMQRLKIKQDAKRKKKE
jgi:hypothetical protein